MSHCWPSQRGAADVADARKSWDAAYSVISVTDSPDVPEDTEVGAAQTRLLQELLDCKCRPKMPNLAEVFRCSAWHLRAFLTPLSAAVLLATACLAEDEEASDSIWMAFHILLAQDGLLGEPYTSQIALLQDSPGGRPGLRASSLSAVGEWDKRGLGVPHKSMKLGKQCNALHESRSTSSMSSANGQASGQANAEPPWTPPQTSVGSLPIRARTLSGLSRMQDCSSGRRRTCLSCRGVDGWTLRSKACARVEQKALLEGLGL